MLPSTQLRPPKVPGFSDLSKLDIKFEPASVADPLKQMITNPKGCWVAFRNNGKSFQQVYAQYAFFLAAIPAICGFIGFGIVGGNGIAKTAPLAIGGYIFSLIFVYAACWLAHGLTLLLDGQSSLDLSANLVVYSLMPFFVTGVFLLHPGLAPFALFGTYSVFMFFRGTEAMTRIRTQKQMLFCLLNVVTWMLFVDRVLAILF